MFTLCFLFQLALDCYDVYIVTRDHIDFFKYLIVSDLIFALLLTPIIFVLIGHAKTAKAEQMIEQATDQKR